MRYGQTRGVRVETQEVVLRGDVATVIALMHIEATVGGRPLPREMRVFSMYNRERRGAEWKLFARSITPVLALGTAGGPE
jgi:ketosteroid isomerase-like protein